MPIESGFGEEEAFVRERVARMVGVEAAETWIRKPNVHLGSRSPIELIRQGRGEDVRDIVAALEDGTFL